MTKKEQRELIEVLNTGLMLYVHDEHDRKHLAEMVAEKLNLPRSFVVGVLA